MSRESTSGKTRYWWPGLATEGRLLGFAELAFAPSRERGDWCGALVEGDASRKKLRRLVSFYYETPIRTVLS